MRLGVPEMPSLLVAHRRPGFYLRVIEEGMVAPGDAIFKVADGRHQLSVAAVDGLLYLPNRSDELLRLAVDVPALSPGWQRSFQDALAAVEAGADASQPEIGKEPGWTGFRPFVTTEVVHETPSVISLYLRDRSGGPLPDPMPGQYLTIRVPVNGATAIRSYSISGHPDSTTYRISVKREEHGTVSRHIHDTIQRGSVLDVAAPRGDFVLAPGDDPVVLLSAGIGITPVLAMLAFTAATNPTRPVWWIHVARTPEDYALAAEVNALLHDLPQARSLIYLTRSSLPADGGTPGTVSGRLDLEQLRTLDLPTGSRAYICGPTGFITAMTDALERIGFAPANIHSEIFGALAPLNPGVVARDAVPVHAPAGPPGNGPGVTFARSGLSVNWSDEYGSLLELAEACDVPTRWVCRTGVCHTCITGLVSGRVDYSPEPLERPDASETLLCCSQPTDDVVLDA
jgi:ferredoxin-NADP reductase